MTKSKKLICCICGKEIKGKGNNPAGAAWRQLDGRIVMPIFGEDDRCCDGCNRLYVIPGRLYQASKDKK